MDPASSALTRFLEQLRRGCDQAGVSEGRLLVAVSGGADSVSLLRGLQALASERGLILHAAHLDHGLRAESAVDAAWVRTLCEQLQIPLTSGTADVRETATGQREGIEATARKVRYQFLEQTARELNCSQVAVAHTADDQVETVLHHLLRGTGLAGLRGMRAQRPLPGGALLVRPLLPVRRNEVVAALAEWGQAFLTDSSNLDLAFTRNRIRRDLLPRLRAEYQPRVDEALLRLAEQAADLEALVEPLVAQALSNAVLNWDERGALLSISVLQRQPRHVLRALFLRLWQRCGWPVQAMGFVAWERLATLVEQPGRINLPGNLFATHRRGTLQITTPAPRSGIITPAEQAEDSDETPSGD